MEEVTDQSASSSYSSPLDVMNFLNEIAHEHPHAISFASGRPAEKFFNIEEWLSNRPLFVQYFASEQNIRILDATNAIAQYGQTNGAIGDLVSKQLLNDEDVSCAGRQILITSGCQEALSLLITTLCQNSNDVIIARSPCYIGATGVAYLNKIEIAPFFPRDVENIEVSLRRTIDEVERRGKRPRILYLVPDFDNPTGSVLTLSERMRIIETCAEKSIIVLEDNPYGMFRFEGEQIRKMFSLDSYGCVIYLGTYSKTICPSLRVGFALIPSTLLGSESGAIDLMNQLSQAKSFSSVNTSQFNQAIVGGLLLKEDCTLAKTVAPIRAHYKRNRDLVIDALSSAFHELPDKVSWNLPSGGFFIVISLPFSFKLAEMKSCATDWGVLVMPLSFFAFNEAEDFRVRLAFSNLAEEQITEGIRRFGEFVKSRIRLRN